MVRTSFLSTEPVTRVPDRPSLAVRTFRPLPWGDTILEHDEANTLCTLDECNTIRKVLLVSLSPSRASSFRPPSWFKKNVGNISAEMSEMLVF